MEHMAVKVQALQKNLGMGRLAVEHPAALAAAASASPPQSQGTRVLRAPRQPLPLPLQGRADRTTAVWGRC